MQTVEGVCVYARNTVLNRLCIERKINPSLSYDTLRKEGKLEKGKGEQGGKQSVCSCSV
jgi:hypothetical protein